MRFIWFVVAVQLFGCAAEVQDAASAGSADAGASGGGAGGSCDASMLLLGSLSETCPLPAMRIGAPLCGSCEPIRCDTPDGTASCGLVTGRCVAGWCIER